MMRKVKDLFNRCRAIFAKEAKLTWVALFLSVFTLIAYHIPFYKHVAANVGSGFNGVWIFIGLLLVMLTLNFFFYYLTLYLGRIVGKCFLAFTFIANSVTLYFINNYSALITAEMMGNVFNTRYSETSGFFSWTMLFYVLLLGIVPCVYIFIRKINYGSIRRFFANIGIALGIAVAIPFAHMPNWPWIDYNASQLGSLLMPWSYIVNTGRYFHQEYLRNRKEIRLPDAQIVTDSKGVCVLVIGESARRGNFSLYGYNRPTNPLLSQDSVIALKAKASATYTTEGVKAIVSYKPSRELYEILPNYLYRTGVEVIWRTSNWGEPPLHIDKCFNTKDLAKLYPKEDARYDGILLAGLKDQIMECDKDKILIIIHTSTSHGPAYYTKYPSQFEVFKPVCKTVEMAKANRKELMNAYDNTILYTDYLLHSIIDILRDIPDRRCCMMYVSDHGESLGEKNLYMHGVSMKMAPNEQIDIPFIVWCSDKAQQSSIAYKEVGHYHIFHSVLSFLGISTPIYNPNCDIFHP